MDPSSDLASDLKNQIDQHIRASLGAPTSTRVSQRVRSTTTREGAVAMARQKVPLIVVVDVPSGSLGIIEDDVRRELESTGITFDALQIYYVRHDKHRSELDDMELNPTIDDQVPSHERFLMNLGPHI